MADLGNEADPVQPIPDPNRYVPPVDDDEFDDDDGKGGKRAVLADLARERRERKTLAKELEQLRTASQSEQEKAIAKAKSEGATEALTKANERVLKAEVRAAAKGKLADPADAAVFLDLSQFEVGEDGDVDQKAIDKAIDDLLKRKPHLAGAGGKRPAGGADGGARGNGKTPPDMNAWLRGERVSL